jgi:hypothetical protein
VAQTYYLPEEQLVQRALEVLMAALGPMETTRFLTLMREERIESVARHHQWQAGLDRNTFYNQVFGEVDPADS